MGELTRRKEAEAEFTELLEALGPALHAFARRILQDEQKAQDVIQEVFLRLWQNRADWSAIANMESWLYRVAENKVIDLLRKKAIENKWRNRAAERTQTPAPDNAALLENREFSDLLARAIDQLPARRQQIYRLHKEESLSYRQIADEMHLSPHTVKNQLFQALKYLRSCLRGLRG